MKNLLITSLFLLSSLSSYAAVYHGKEVIEDGITVHAVVMSRNEVQQQLAELDLDSGDISKIAEFMKLFESPKGEKMPFVVLSYLIRFQNRLNAPLADQADAVGVRVLCPFAADGSEYSPVVEAVYPNQQEEIPTVIETEDADGLDVVSLFLLFKHNPKLFAVALLHKIAGKKIEKELKRTGERVEKELKRFGEKVEAELERTGNRVGKEAERTAEKVEKEAKRVVKKVKKVFKKIF